MQVVLSRMTRILMLSLYIIIALGVLQSTNAVPLDDPQPLGPLRQAANTTLLSPETSFQPGNSDNAPIQPSNKVPHPYEIAGDPGWTLVFREYRAEYITVDQAHKDITKFQDWVTKVVRDLLRPLTGLSSVLLHP